MKLATYFSRCFIILVLVACLTIAEEVDEFSYDEDSNIGPAHWGEIRPEWRNCSTGRLQSPIDLLNHRVEIVSYLGRLKRAYKPSHANLTNLGHAMMINGTLFQLMQCHWHSPSEHTINGRRFNIEIHLVHQSINDNRTAVIGIMYKIGHPDSFLSMMKPDLEAVAHKRINERIPVGIIDPNLIKFGSRKYYRYIGSLTTPPCSPNVIWTIVRKVRTVTREQVELIRDALDDKSKANARPLQPIRDRVVELYRPRDHEN
ncbi:Carbonic anhydrase [Handroanthus impetiginosus]|uniref:Carbonic anhydrase n=1 Tax=Handroanthus impetiginosus TaxID=429701 RepID=A0A2G9GBT9_9LAMI|nr:Carbonic anhydrase [Handroanthus impetiginosus]